MAKHGILPIHPILFGFREFSSPWQPLLHALASINLPIGEFPVADVMYA